MVLWISLTFSMALLLVAVIIAWVMYYVNTKDKIYILEKTIESLLEQNKKQGDVENGRK